MVSDDPAYFGRSLNCEAACKRIRQLADMTGNEETPASSKRTRKRKSTLLPFCFAKPDFAPASPAASAFADVLKELKLDDLPGYLDFVTGTVLVSIYRIPSSGGRRSGDPVNRIPAEQNGERVPFLSRDAQSVC